MRFKSYFMGKIKDFIPQKIGFHISCKLSHKETICMKFQILFFWGKKRNKCFKMLSTEIFTQHAKH